MQHVIETPKGVRLKFNDFGLCTEMSFPAPWLKDMTSDQREEYRARFKAAAEQILWNLYAARNN